VNQRRYARAVLPPWTARAYRRWFTCAALLGAACYGLYALVAVPRGLPSDPLLRLAAGACDGTVIGLVLGVLAAVLAAGRASATASASTFIRAFVLALLLGYAALLATPYAGVPGALLVLAGGCVVARLLARR
jgi:hypothetical protein